MFRRNHHRLLLTLALVLVAGPLLAQSGPTNGGDTGLFTLSTADTLPKGEWSVGFYGNNWDLDSAPVPSLGPFRDFDTMAYDRTELSFSLAYGLSDHFEIGLSAAYAMLDEGRDQVAGQINGIRYVEKIDNRGAAPLRLRLKWNAWEASDEMTRFSLTAGAEIPTTSENYDDPIQTGELDYRIGAVFTSRYVTFGLDYLMRDDRGPFEMPNEFKAGLGLDVPVTPRTDFIVELQHVLFEDLGDHPLYQASPRDQTEATLGVRYFVNDVVALNAGLRSNLTMALSGSHGNGHTALGWVAGVTYYPWTKGRRQTMIEGYGWVKKDPPPPPVITAPVDGATLTSEMVEVSGTGIPGATVQLSVDGMPGPTALVDENGNWTATVGPVEPGAHAVAATQTDPVTGLTSEPSEVVRFSYEKPLPPPPPPVVEPKPETVMKDTVRFEKADVLTNIAKAILDQAALRLKSDETATAEIVGHTDSRGSEDSNMKMSVKRAEACRDYLVDRHGIDPSRIEIAGRGETEPEGDNDTAAGRKLNRRAMITVTVLR